MAAGKWRLPGRLLLAVLLVLLARPAAHAGEIPPVPAIDGTGEFVHDLAGVLYVQDLPQGHHKTIFDAQKTAFEQHDTPIIVVTIRQMAAFGYEQEDIQPFAEKWFNKWKIGTLETPQGHNRGILLLVSVGDRKGRIELGADWEHRFDGACQQIMDNVMVPHFKQEDYAAGIAAGVEVLGKMASVGPVGDPESLGLGPARKQRGGGFDLLKYSFFSPLNFFLMIAGGLGLIFLGVHAGSGPDATAGKKKIRFWLIFAGLVTIIISFCTALLAFLFMWLFVYVPLKLLELLCGLLGLRVRFFSGGSSSGGSYSGGGYSGGYSGGGGASGSW